MVFTKVDYLSCLHAMRNVIGALLNQLGHNLRDMTVKVEALGPKMAENMNEIQEFYEISEEKKKTYFRHKE